MTLRFMSRPALLVLLLASLFTTLVASAAHAKEMQGRLGLGYNNEFSNGVPGVSIKYGMTRDIAIEGVAGLATTSPTNTVAAVKLFKNLFYETNLNFYFMLGGGILNANGNSGAEFLGGFGAEFFFPGIESLGFAVETGGRFENVTTGSFVLKTLGASFLDAGIHFYF